LSGSSALRSSDSPTEQRLDKVALRSELIELKNRMAGLQEQVLALEARLGE
jgi:hypothetical protein